MVVAMYHDQGHGPIKVLGLEAGVKQTVVRLAGDPHFGADKIGLGQGHCRRTHADRSVAGGELSLRSEQPSARWMRTTTSPSTPSGSSHQMPMLSIVIVLADPAARSYDF